MKTILKLSAAAFLLAAPLSATANAQEGGVQLGQLNCVVEGGTGFIFGSSKNLTCEFTPANDAFPKEIYFGTIDKFGVDIGVTGETFIAWTVVAAESDLYAPKALAGTYTGGTASAAFVAGLGANVLVGGSEESFALQPLSVSASEGVNVAVGLAQINLK